MKRFITVAAAIAITLVLISALLLWPIFGPSVILIRNVGNQQAQVVLTDADHSTLVWSGKLDPGDRKTVRVWFKHEGGPELRCRDQISTNTAQLDYVTGLMPINAEVEIAGCNRIDPHFRR